MGRLRIKCFDSMPVLYFLWFCVELDIGSAVAFLGWSVVGLDVDSIIGLDIGAFICPGIKRELDGSNVGLVVDRIVEFAVRSVVGIAL